MSDLPSVFQSALPGSADALAERRLTEASCDELLREAERLGIFAAVYSSLRQAGYRPQAEHWGRRFQASGAKNLFLKREQVRILDAMRDAGVACLPVRGVALTEALYPDVFWREIADLDLLVAPGDVSRAYRVLKAVGLDDLDNPWSDVALQRVVRRAAYHYPEIRMTGRHALAVELHWDWVEPALPSGDLFSDGEAYLVYLCRHAAKHLWLDFQVDLRWLVDIEIFLRQRGPGLKWERFWELARAMRATEGCAGTLELCGRLGANMYPKRHDVPSRYVRSGRRLATRVEGWLISGKTGPFARHRAVQLLRADGPWRGVRRLASWVTPAPRHWSRADGSTPSTVEVWVHRYRNLALRGAAAICPSASWRRRLKRASEWSSRDWSVLARAWVLLPLMAAGVRGRRFPRTQAWAARVRAVDPPKQAADRAAQVGALVKVASQRHLGQFLCLPRSLTLLRLLGREGMSAELKLGVRQQNGKVEGHAWVEYEGLAVNEPGDPSGEFRPLVGARDEAHSTRSSS